MHFTQGLVFWFGFRILVVMVGQFVTLEAVCSVSQLASNGAQSDCFGPIDRNLKVCSVPTESLGHEAQEPDAAFVAGQVEYSARGPAFEHTNLNPTEWDGSDVSETAPSSLSSQLPSYMAPQSGSVSQKRLESGSRNTSFVSFPELVQYQMNFPHSNSNLPGGCSLNIRSVTSAPEKSTLFWDSAFSESPKKKPANECENCHTTTTPFWRRISTGSLVCNACGLYFKTKSRHRPIALQQYNGRRLRSKEYRCVNCLTTSTPLWRKTQQKEPICNACGLYLKLHGKHRPFKESYQVAFTTHAHELMQQEAFCCNPASNPYTAVPESSFNHAVSCVSSSPAPMPPHQSEFDGKTTRCASVPFPTVQNSATPNGKRSVNLVRSEIPTDYDRIFAPFYYAFVGEQNAKALCTNNFTPPPEDMPYSFAFLSNSGSKQAAKVPSCNVEGSEEMLNYIADSVPVLKQQNSACPPETASTCASSNLSSTPLSTRMCNSACGITCSLFESLSQHVSDSYGIADSDVWDNFVF